MKRSALQNKQIEVLRMALRARKVFGTFEKLGPRPSCSKTDYANPGLVEILIALYLRLKADFPQD